MQAVLNKIFMVARQDDWRAILRRGSLSRMRISPKPPETSTIGARLTAKKEQTMKMFLKLEQNRYKLVAGLMAR